MEHPDLTPEHQWPLVRLDVTDRAPMDAAHAVNNALLAATSRQEPFAALIQMPSRTDRAPKRRRVIASVGERIRMLKQLRPRLKETCLGLAFVVSAAELAANAKTIQAGDKLWGCPTFATENVDTALAWARAKLDANPEREASVEGDS